jgi:2-oxo-3-hexenedioate decarboxylase
VLNEARLNAKPIQQISQQLKFSRSDAYAIQEKQLQLRQVAGETQIGWKMGLTSEAKRRQMNLDSPLYGFLTDQMQVPPKTLFSLKGKIHPKIEPEIAFWIKNDLVPDKNGSVSRDQVLKSCAGVCACMEILDSRYQQFKYFSMEDVIADNSSSSDFVLGPWREDFHGLDLLNLYMEMSPSGQIAQKGISQDISGDPVLSVIQLCQLLQERGQILKGGSIVLAGAATAAVELTPGLKVELKVDGLEPVSIRVED